MKEQWCIPKVGGEFVWRMEDVLDLYAEPYDPRRPQVCFDEKPYQLLDDVKPAIETQQGCPKRIDYEYERKGSCNIFGVVQPLTGWRHMDVTEHRKNEDFAHQMKSLVDEHFPEADVIRIVLDNLSTHTPVALYQTFPAEEARRIARKLEFHYTPKHGSWLNMIEIEFSVMARQCLDRRLPDIPTLAQEIGAWECARNDQHAKIHWRFTTDAARTTLKRLYPIISPVSDY